MTQPLEMAMKSLLENTPVQGLKAGPWFETAQTTAPDLLRQLIYEDVVRRGYVFEDEKHPFNPEKPFIVYAPMNREPELGVGIMVLRMAFHELGVLRNEKFSVLMAPNSATWMLRTLPYVRRDFPGIEPILATKDPKEARLWQTAGAEVTTIGVSSYTRGRIKGLEGSEDVFIRNLGKAVGKRLVIVDDALAEGKTAIDLAAGITAAAQKGGVALEWLDFVAIVSKRIQNGYYRCVGSGYYHGVVEAAPVADITGEKGNRKIVLVDKGI